MLMKTPLLRLAAAMVGSMLIAPLALAQAAPYPSKPITMVVGFPPGGISDLLARVLADRLAAQMGTTVLVQNKPGAATTIASASVASAPADGYTLYFQDMTSHAITASAYRHLKYDPMTDFTWVSMVASTPLMLVSSTASKAKDLKKLIAQAKAAPQPLPYASSGNGTITHLATEIFNQQAGIKALHVPYKGGAGQTQAVIAGEVAYAFASMPPAIMQMKSGTAYALAVTSGKRVSASPDVPTLKESGVSLELLIYSGLIGPKDLPAPVVERLNSEVRKALATPQMQKVLADTGADAMSGSPAEFAALMRNEGASMAKVVKTVGVVLD